MLARLALVPMRLGEVGASVWTTFILLPIASRGASAAPPQSIRRPTSPALLRWPSCMRAPSVGVGARARRLPTGLQSRTSRAGVRTPHPTLIGTASSALRSLLRGKGQRSGGSRDGQCLQRLEAGHLSARTRLECFPVAHDIKRRRTSYAGSSAKTSESPLTDEDGDPGASSIPAAAVAARWPVSSYSYSSFSSSSSSDVPGGEGSAGSAL